MRDSSQRRLCRELSGHGLEKQPLMGLGAENKRIWGVTRTWKARWFCPVPPEAQSSWAAGDQRGVVCEPGDPWCLSGKQRADSPCVWAPSSTPQDPQVGHENSFRKLLKVCPSARNSSERLCVATRAGPLAHPGQLCSVPPPHWFPLVIHWWLQLRLTVSPVVGQQGCDRGQWWGSFFSLLCFFFLSYFIMFEVVSDGVYGRRASGQFLAQVDVSSSPHTCSL